MYAHTYKFNESILAQMFAFILLFIGQLKYVEKEIKRERIRYGRKSENSSLP